MIITHHGIEIALPESIAVLFGYFSVRGDVLLTTLVGTAGGTFVGEKEIEVDLRVVDGVAGYHFLEVVPLPHDFLVLGEVGRDGPLEKCFEGLN